MGLLAPTAAWAQCVVGGVTVTCSTTSTTDTTYSTNPPNDRHYTGPIATPIIVNVNSGATVSGNGIAVTNTAAGGVTINNGGTISVDAGNTPTAGGTAALSLTASGGPIVYTGGDVINNGNGNAFDAVQNGGVGSVSITAGNVFAATGEGITVRDVATSTGIDITTNGTVTALTAGKDGIDAQSQSLTGNVTITANGDVNAGNAGIVGAIFPAGGTGNVDLTANGAINARFGVDAENFGTGNTTVTTVGPVNATSGNGIFAKTSGGNVTVNAGDVTATGNTAIVGRQTNAAGAGFVDITAGNVSGTTGIEATNSGSGAISVTANGTVTGTSAEGINANGNNAVTISVANAVTGATRGLNLVGGTGGAGNISVTGTGGFFGGTDDAAHIQNNGSGTVTVNISGASGSTGGEGIVVRDTAAGGNISVTTGAVTALTAGKDGIDVQAQSLTGNVTIVANGDINAGNAGIVGAIFPAGGTGNVDVTANGAINARFGVDAENFGTGNTTVTTVGPVNATSGNGIFAKTSGGNVTVNAGDVTATGNTAVIGRQTNAAGAGIVDITVGNVSGTTGVEATNSGSGATNVTANGTVTGTTAEGINATGNGAVTISVADTVTGATRGLNLVGGTGGTGNISVTGTGGFLGGTGNGAHILNNGSGTVTVNISGASGSTGGEGIVVRDTAAGGNISVTTGAVTALTAGMDGIDTQSQSLTANVTEVANGDIDAGNAGMVAAIFPAAATGNIDVTANGAINARFGVDAENFGTGTTSVTTVGPVNVTSGNGVFALTTGGDVSVTANDVTSTGNTAVVARQNNAAGAGVIDVRVGNVSGTTGVEATNSGTGETDVTVNGTATGTSAEGIKATGNAAVNVLVGGAVTGATNGLTLVGGTGGAGNISVTGTGGFFGGTGDGANIKNNGSGTVTVDISGASGSTAGNGIVVRDTAAGGDINVTTGAVSALAAGKNAIDALTLSTTANVTIVANGDVKAGNAGIVGAVIPGAGTGNVDITANGAIDARFGVDAENFGSGSTQVTTVGPVTATSGNGIYASSTGGNVTVDAGDVTSTGNTAIIARQNNAAGAGLVDVTAGNISGTTGIDASNSGTGTLKVTANGTVTGTTLEGIKAIGNDAVTVSVADKVTGTTNGLALVGGTGGAGNISVTGAGGFFGGTGDGANIKNNGSGTVTVDISGASGSAGGNGIVVRDTATGGDVSVTTGAVTAITTGKNAIDAITLSTGANLTIVANGDIQAGNAGIVGAIIPGAATGNIDITANGAIDARFGVDAENFGSGSTSVTTVGPVSVTSGNGIYASSTGGNVTVNAGNVTSTGNTAIVARQNNAAGAGPIDVTAGNVSGTTGIDALNSGTGSLSVTANGTVEGTSLEGIKAIGNAGVTVSVADSVIGATNGLTLVGGTGGAGNISVTGAGGFLGGTGDGANIKNNGSGTVTVDISGASGSTSGNGIIVRDTAAGGDISLTTGAVTALTVGKNAIDAVSVSTGANLTIVANGDVAAGNAGIVGAIIPGAATGNIDITANGAIDARFGVDAENFGSGSTLVTTVGPVTATSGNGIYASSAGGNVTVNAGDVSSTGNIALIGQQTNAAGSGVVDVTGGNVSGTTGIVAINFGTGAANVTANGTVTGTTAEGIRAIGNDAVSVGAANTVTGATNGLTLIGGSGGAGNISVTGTGGFFGGTGDGANIQNNGSGTVTFNISGASGSTGGNGIVVRDTAAGGDIDVTTGAVTALAAGMNGIDVRSVSNTANLAIVANGDIDAGNSGIVGAIINAGGAGNVDVTTNGATNGRFGIDAENFGAGYVSVTAVGPVAASTGNGIFALTDGGNITVNAGDVTSTGNVGIIGQQTNAAGAGNIDLTGDTVSGTIGVAAANSGTGTTSVTTTGLVTGTAAEGIFAVGNDAVTVNVADTVTGATSGLTLVGGTGGAGNILVTGTGGFAGQNGNGASIQNNGSGTVTVNNSGPTTATGGSGILVRDTNAGGDINVTIGAVSSTDQNGIDVFGSSLTGNVAVTTNGDVNAGNAGIVAGLIATSTGNVDVTTNAAVNGVFGIDAENYGTGMVTVNAVGPVTGTTGYGIVALTEGGDLTVTANDVSSTASTALLAEQIKPGGGGSVGVTVGNASGTSGVIAQTNGSGGVSVSALGNVTATNGNGITALNYDAAANAGTIDVSLGAGGTISATHGAGIYTDSGLSTGMTTITVGGEITAGSPGYAGVYGNSTSGGITVNVTGTGKIDPDYGIDLSTVDGPLVVNNAGLVAGAIDGVRLVATGTGSANVSNTGTITGGTNAVLISVNGTPSTLYNNGTLNGAVNVFGSAIATSNWINGPLGIANLTGSSNYSGNLVNGGNVNLAAGSSLVVLGNSNNAGRVTFAGAGTFTTAGSMANTGIINARNNLTSNVVNVGGNYSGGGQFWADYSTNTATADRLNIGGSASGNTNVTLNLVGTRSFVSGGFLPVVTVGGAAPANAFTSSTVFATSGFILDSFGQNPSNAHQFGLIQTVNPQASALGALTYMAESGSGLLDEPISPFITNRTDAGGTRFSLWMRGNGGHTTQTIASTLSGGGVSYVGSRRVRIDHYAAELGADLALVNIGGGWNVNLGIMGGWYGANAPLAGGERIKVEAPFVGGYLAVGNGGFMLEGNIRKEWRHYRLAMPSMFGGQGLAKTDGDATAGSIRASYRIGGKTGFAATPFASFNYADTGIDPLQIDAFTVFTPGDDTTKIGQAGLRVSYRGGDADKFTLEPFASAARLENWSRGSSGSFAFGTPVTTFSLQSSTWKDAMRYSLGVIGNARGGRVSGFVVGNIDDGSRLRAFTLNAGLRFNF
ncbi:MAG: hypothetical protein ACTHJR_18255 [Sphingomonas sp.]|uniref:hypothetical protein n=1 Tax=Sphingomonas sp. TaxID=28214 RepID=UPI003F81DF67